jgi:hypothetical protein
MGTSSVSSLVLIQEIVDVTQRGSATASNLFSRNLGSTLGATLFGAVLNFGLSHSKDVAAVTSDQLKALLQTQVQTQAASIGSGDAIRQVLHESLHLTFLSIFVIAIFVVVFLVFVPAINIGGEKKMPPEGLSPVEH